MMRRTDIALVALVALASAGHCLAASSLSAATSKFLQGRAALDPAALELAEEFARRVGENRLYKHDLHLGSYNRADMAHLNLYVFKLTSDGQLKQTGDVDAAIEVLRRFGKSDAELEAAAGQLVEGLLVPACAAYANALRAAFEGPEVADASALNEEIKAGGYTPEVQNFIYGWAHYRTCKLLVSSDRALLARRIPSRLDDQRRLAARRLARAQKEQS